MGFAIAAGVMAVGAGIMSAVGNAQKKKAERRALRAQHKAQVQDTERQIAQVDLDHRNQQELFMLQLGGYEIDDQGNAHLTGDGGFLQADLRAANKQLDQKIEDTTSNRDSNLRSNSFELAATDTINNLQLAAMQVQAAQEYGKGVQGAATSGFRDTGSSLNAAYQSENEATLSENLQKERAASQQQAAYYSARNNYAQYNQGIEGYRAEQAENQRQTDQRISEYLAKAAGMEREYQRVHGDLQSDLDWLNTDGYNLLQDTLEENRMSTWIENTATMFQSGASALSGVAPYAS